MSPNVQNFLNIISIPNIFSLQRVLWVYGVKIPMEQGLKSGKSNNGTGYPEKTPAAHTRHFRGHVPPPGANPSLIKHNI